MMAQAERIYICGIYICWPLMEFSVQREKVVETLTSGLVFPQLFLFTQSETTHVSISQLDYELKISIAHRNQEL